MKLLLLLVTVLVVACNSNKPYQNSFKDSVVQEYFRYHDSLGVDTGEDNYKILKAYLADKTQFFKELQHKESILKGLNQWRYAEDSCVHQAKLANLNIDEGYRFIYGQAFSRVMHNITITKKGDSIKLHYVEFGRSSDTLNVNHVIKDYEKKLNIVMWDNLQTALNKADLWGLKADNGLHGLDGDFVDVYGYKRLRPNDEHPRYTFVSRWAVGWSSLDAPLYMLFDFAGAEMR